MTDEYEYLDRDLDSGQPLYLNGRLEAGPLDGVGFAIEGAFHSGLRGIRLELCLGQDLASSDWHIYHVAGQSYTPETGPVLRAVHLGTLDGSPEDWPEGTRPAD